MASQKVCIFEVKNVTQQTLQLENCPLIVGVF